MRRVILPLCLALMLSGCGVTYQLVKPAPTPVVKGAMKVTPSIAWNKASKGTGDIAWEESWTQNGPLLDAITFIGALPAGQSVVKQKPKDTRKVPVFRADMTPQDLVSMVESYYRIKAGATIFETTGVQPTTFLNKPAVQLDYKYVGGDEVKRRGRVTMAIVNGKLYSIALDAAALHYFDAALPEFESLVRSASAT